jgi:2,4-dienoyl-CoA reductase-like NADH-dependent reductase (Old Yellow Enzyme family)
MKTDYKHVLEPIQIGPMKLKNRVSFTPVWTSFATADGQVNKALVEWG